MQRGFAGSADWRIVSLGALWIGALYGVLQVRHLTGWWNHWSLCGPWGCGAASEALAAWHGFWLVLLLPATVMIAGRVSRRLLRQAALLTTLTTLLLVIGIFGFAAYEWLQQASPENRSFLVQRCLFVLLYELSDIPLVQLLLCGVAGLTAVRSGKHRRLLNDNLCGNRVIDEGTNHVEQ